MRENDLDNVERCLDQGADVNNVRDERGRTPLMIACAHGHEEIVERLLGAGADVNIQDDRGSTAPMLTTWMDHPACLLRLAQVQGFDPIIQDDDGWSVALLASTESPGCIDVLRNLAEVDWNIEDNDGHSPLFCGPENNNIPLVHLFFSRPVLHVNRQFLFEHNLLDRAVAEARTFVDTKMAEEGVVMDRVQFARLKGWSNDLIGLLNHGHGDGDSY